MKQAMLFAAAFGLAFVDSVSAPQELRLAPAEGLVLERTFDRISETERVSTSRRGSNTSTSETTWTLVVTDEFEAVEDGHTLRLERAFDEVEMEIESSMSFGDQSRDDSRAISCEIDGATVLFEWDEDEEAYLATSDDVGEEILDRLLFDLDFTTLLPDDEVQEGDEWEIDLALFRTSTDPWHGLPWEWEGEERRGRGDEEPEGIEEDGYMRATYAGTRDEDGVVLAVVLLEGEIEIETDREVFHEGERGSQTMQIVASETRTLEGKALWDLEGGYLKSLVLEIDSSREATTEGVIVRGDREIEIESESESETTTLFTVETQIAD